VVDIGQRRFLICQRCGAHRGKTGSSLEQIQREYADHFNWWLRVPDRNCITLPDGDCASTQPCMHTER
jgi:hypothetical protein